MDIESLPPEMMIKIFQMLDPRSLKQSAIVCKKWKNITDWSALWSWCTLRLDSPRSLVKLEMNRAKNIEQICLEDCDSNDLNQIIKAVENLPKIKINLGTRSQKHFSCRTQTSGKDN